MGGRSKSSDQWLRRQQKDDFVRRAQAEGFRSRAAYKLMEIQQRDRILHPGMVVVDLGAAPGAWSQVAARAVGKRGRVIALDCLEMTPLAGVEVLQGDFTEQATLDALNQCLGGAPVDLVLSDMAPNISGVKAVDQPRAMYLAELALAFAEQALKPGGVMVVKLFQGEGFEAFVSLLKQRFQRLAHRKPQASRNKSREVYAVAQGYNV